MLAADSFTEHHVMFTGHLLQEIECLMRDNIEIQYLSHLNVHCMETPLSPKAYFHFIF